MRREFRNPAGHRTLSKLAPDASGAHRTHAQRVPQNARTPDANHRTHRPASGAYRPVPYPSWARHCLHRTLRLSVTPATSPNCENANTRALVGTHFVVLAHFDSALFEKMKCIFSIAPVGSLEKSRETLTGRWPWKHWTLSLRVRCTVVLGSTRVKHQTVSTGRRVAHVHVSGAI